MVRSPPVQRLGRAFFRWRSFTPVPLLVAAGLIVVRNRGAAHWAWAGCGLALCAAGQALRASVLGQVRDGTSGQNEKLIATRLNTQGPYALTRNPLYLGNLAIVLGLCLVAHSWLLLALCAVLFAVQYRFIIAAEEGFLLERFGAQYEAYRARVPRFWPRLAAMPPGLPWDGRRALRKEHNPAAAWLAIAIVLLMSDRRGVAPSWPWWLALGLVATAWLGVKGWKHGWARGNFAADFRRRLRETAR